ncbi:thioesterase II family protein [Actinocrispum wychmicini]|uniref:Surfactin synthase thioesterase subunit n=1 Tax=Actinocrispum wychmicini TaxID=1213861 RepID=A0A4R2J8W0_9PSEU|nr:alpha/beta fold hydrolase [Actinocrispum wychmicini]TCO55753.1 surfactin synthase thioesterase subunit [Actinocrispum wychmicini]
MTTVPITVLCMPHAGAGAGFFWAWRQVAPEGLRLAPMQLPGREDRTDEQPHRDVAVAVRSLLPEAVTAAAGSAGIAVFGHSLGAVLAYELARALEERTELPVAHVFVSGSPGPWHGRVKRSDGLDDAEFVARVEELAGYRHPAFDDPEFRALVLPTLRADVAMHESYRPLSDEPIEAPVTCLRGADDTLVSEQDARRWADATTGGFDYVEMPGGHMYLTESAASCLDVVRAATLDEVR